ncbi:ribosomal small subunit pseudouridine synthase A [Marinobacter daqiaonensis]|uniref:Pseudouridine synthase n=1 Tax=Marinobacter daqiaonensis TaxID=650891 RepID=A0A1I6JRD3_9GAMM|nr:pseudouridine synthase [Marinobacter daqiaonensis]SFR81527.1 ribosomal small subunit pseudouridine synthase A [Marinobacter daqiaonensis]
MRLDGYLCQCTDLSRKDARRAISAGRVRVNGKAVRKASASLPAAAEVTLDSTPVSPPGELYLMLHKPPGVLSATTDAAQPVVTDLLPEDIGRRVHPAGRLDLDTTGLLLLTSDGQWSHRITSPRHRCPKTYRVTLAEPLRGDAAGVLESGVMLAGESTPTRPATVTQLDSRVIDLTISEGRYHQVKRMLAAVGNHVTALHRHRIGSVVLDPALAPGEFRHLTGDEIRQLAKTD